MDETINLTLVLGLMLWAISHQLPRVLMRLFLKQSNNSDSGDANLWGKTLVLSGLLTIIVPLTAMCFTVDDYRYSGGLRLLILIFLCAKGLRQFRAGVVLLRSASARSETME